MAQVTWNVSASTVVREPDQGGSGEGCGGSTRLLVGRRGSGNLRNYRSYLKFNLDWTGIQSISSAVLYLYTADDGTLENPQVTIKRLNNDFTVGSNPDGVFSAADYTNPGPPAAADAVAANLSRSANAENRIDITAMVRAWAPASVSGGGRAPNYGVGLYGTTGATAYREDWAGWSAQAAANLRPKIVVTYTPTPSEPQTPTNLVPTGAVQVVTSFEGDYSSPSNRALDRTMVEVYTQDGTSPIWTVTRSATDAERAANHFKVLPDGLRLQPNTPYRWRAKVIDEAGGESPWTALTSFSFSHPSPNPPTLSPNGASFADLSGVVFRGNFSSPDSGAKLRAYQIQWSAYPAGDPNWDDASAIKWDSGKQYLPSDASSWQAAYGGVGLTAGTWYWRARVWDQYDAVSDWGYASITLTASYNPGPRTYGVLEPVMSDRYRILIKRLNPQDRGPGEVVAVIENALNVGARISYNSPGELHFTLAVDDPQIAVIEPRKTHYAVEFADHDGWHEVFAGLITDFDATETSVIFYGIDYLGLLGALMDERFTPSDPDRSADKGGSYYVSQPISAIVADQLQRARTLTGSPVGFISIGPIAAMDERVSVHAALQPTLQFLVGLLDSHRQGTGKKTRLQVRRTPSGGYEFAVTEHLITDPPKDNLRLRYGELVQSYRVVPFGPNWASVVNVVGRSQNGVRVFSVSQAAPNLDLNTWGRFTRSVVIDNVIDENDLKRRAQEEALRSGKLGQQLGLQIRSGLLRPLSGYNLLDTFPVTIIDGAVNTLNFGSGYWTCYGVSWEVRENGGEDVSLILLPREDTVAPAGDLIDSKRISPQAEWQVGWKAPDPLKTTSMYWLDQTSGIVYKRSDDSPAIQISAGSGTTITCASPHGFSAGTRIYFGNLVPGTTGIVEGQVYVVLPAGLSLTQFQFSTAPNGQPISLRVPLTSGVVSLAPTYKPITDPNDVMAPPPAISPPTNLTLSSASRLDSDGHAQISLTISLVQPTESTLRESVVSVSPPNGPVTKVSIPKGQTTTTIPSVLGRTQYTATAIAYDVYGNASAQTAPVSIVTVGDNAAPPVPANLSASAGILMAVISWNAVTVDDLRHYELGVSTDNGVTFPTVHTTKATVMTLSGLTAGQQYTFRVRAVDLSGNVSAWSPTVSATPRKVTGSGLSGADIEALSISGNDIKARSIDAVKIAVNSITADELSASSVTASELAAGSVTSDKVAAGTITGEKIAAGSITADKLAATLLLGSLIKTATGGGGDPGTGLRVEIDRFGIRAYDSTNTLQVNIPADGSPVFIRGNLQATSLIAEASELRNTVTLPPNTTLTAQAGVSDPTTPPSVIISTPKMALPTAPANPSAGLCYDPAGGTAGNTPTFWVGADPTVNGDIAYEYRASDGVLLRTLRKSQSQITYTATAGSTAHYSDQATYWTGSQYSQVTTPITLPNRDNIRITSVSVYAAGVSGYSCTLKNAVWSTGGTLLARSDAYTPSKPAFNNGNSLRYDKLLTTPLSVSPGATILAGFLRTGANDAAQWDQQIATGTTEKRGNGLDGNMTNISTFSGVKPNVYVTYTYTVGVEAEGNIGPVVGITRAGNYIWALDNQGILYQYNQSDLSYVGKFSHASRLTNPANAGLFYENRAVAQNLVILTATGQTGNDQVRLIKVDATTGAYIRTDDLFGFPINGATAVLRGGTITTDSGTETYWIVINNTVQAFATNGGAYRMNREFGAAGDVDGGIVYDGAAFRGWAATNSNMIWTFTNWDWTTATQPYWISYSWFSSTTQYETRVGPRTRVDLGRRRSLAVTLPAIPTVGNPGPDNIRLYAATAASSPPYGSSSLQRQGSSQNVNLSQFVTNQGNDRTTNTFPTTGAPATLEAQSGTGWVLNADGTIRFKNGANSTDISIARSTATNTLLLSGGPLKVAAMAPSMAYATTSPSTTVAAAGTWYMGPTVFRVAITPSFTGQKFLLASKVTLSPSVATVTEILVGLRVDSDTAGTLQKWVDVALFDNAGSTRRKTTTLYGVWVAPSTATHYALLYVRFEGASGTANWYAFADYTTHVDVIPIVNG